MSSRTSVHVIRLAPIYWWAEVKERGGIGAEHREESIAGRGGFASEAEARDWADEITRGHGRRSIDGDGNA